MYHPKGGWSRKNAPSGDHISLVKLGMPISPAEVVKAVVKNENVKSPLSKSGKLTVRSRKLMLYDIDLQLPGKYCNRKLSVSVSDFH